MKKFEEYLEMAVKIRDNILPEISEEDFLAAIEEFDIRSSSDVAYDNQEIKWKKVADKFGVTIEKLGEVVWNLNMGDNFPGIEGLAILSGKKELYNESDYGMTEFDNRSGDQFITSMFYGGKRAENWVKNLKKVNLDRLASELENNDLAIIPNAKFSFFRGPEVKIINAVNMEGIFTDKADVEKTKKAFELMDKWFDFDLDMTKNENGEIILSGKVIKK